MTPVETYANILLIRHDDDASWKAFLETHHIKYTDMWYEPAYLEEVCRAFSTGTYGFEGNQSVQATAPFLFFQGRYPPHEDPDVATVQVHLYAASPADLPEDFLERAEKS